MSPLASKATTWKVLLPISIPIYLNVMSYLLVETAMIFAGEEANHPTRRSQDRAEELADISNCAGNRTKFIVKGDMRTFEYFSPGRTLFCQNRFILMYF